MTPAQLSTVKAAILADSTANAFPNTSDGNFALAAYLNAAKIPAVSVWRNDIAPREVASAVVQSEWVVVTAIKQNGLLLMTQGDRIDATQANVRNGFASIFATGATLTALTALAQRSATRFEAMFLTVAGAANTSSVFGQTISPQDVETARNS